MITSKESSAVMDTNTADGRNVHAFMSGKPRLSVTATPVIVMAAGRTKDGNKNAFVGYGDVYVCGTNSVAPESSYSRLPMSALADH